MEIVTFRCDICGEERERPDWIAPCHGDMCCNCCKKKGLQDAKCKMASLDLERFAEGKMLNRNEFVGMLLEKAMSVALNTLKVEHQHNPYNLTFPCYQVNYPDILIEELGIVIECKNLSGKQAKHLTRKWLDKHIINRTCTSQYGRKLALFSYKPNPSLIKHLNSHDWRVYGLGTQILTLKEEKKAIPKLIKQFYWLKKEYDQTQKPILEQTKP